jgi:hypothetical protein
MGIGLGHRDERTQVRVNAKTTANMYSPTTSAEATYHHVRLIGSEI